MAKFDLTFFTVRYTITAPLQTRLSGYFLFHHKIIMANRYWIATASDKMNNTANWSISSGGAGGASVPGANDTAIFNNGTANCIIDTPWTVGAIQATSNYGGDLVTLAPLICDSLEWAGNKLCLAESTIGSLVLPQSRAAGATVNLDPWGGASYAPQNLQWIARNGTAMKFEWSPVPGAVSYRLQSTSNGTSWSTRNAEHGGTSYSYAASGSGTFWAFRVAANLPEGGYGPWSVIEFDKVTPDFSTPFVPLAPQPITIGSIDTTAGTHPLVVNIWTEIEASGDIEISPAGDITISHDANGRIKLFGSQDQNICVLQAPLDYTLSKPAGKLTFITTEGTIQSSILRGATDDPRDVTLLDLQIGSDSGYSATMTLAGDVAARSANILFSTLNIANGTTLDVCSVYENAGSAVNNLGTIRAHAGNATLDGGGTRGNVVYWGTVAPPAPTGLSATAMSPMAASLFWSGSSGATSYTVEKSTNQADWSTVWTGTGTAATVSGLASGTTYYFRVKASNASGDSGWSNIASATTLGVVPTPPAAPNQVIVDEATMTLTSLFAYWIAVAGATNYVLEVSTSGIVGWVVMHNGPGTSVTITDMTPTATYFLRVKAQNAAGDSPWSGVTHVMPRGYPAPTPLVVTHISYDAVDLEWNVAGTPPGYVIAWSFDDGDHWLEMTTGPQRSASVTDLTPNTVYQFRVKSRYAVADSPWSEIVETTTLPTVPEPETPTTSVVIVKRISQKYAVKTAFFPHSL